MVEFSRKFVLSWFFIFGTVDYWFNLLLVCSDFLFFFFSYSVLIGCVFLEILHYLICWHILVHSSFLWSKYFYSIRCDISSFIFNFMYLFFFFLFGLGKDLSILFTFPRNQFLVLLILSIVLLFLFHLFPLWCLFISILLIQGWICSFSNALFI